MEELELDKIEEIMFKNSLMNLISVCIEKNSLDEAIPAFYNFYKNKDKLIPEELCEIKNLSEDEKYSNFLKIMELGMGVKGAGKVYENLFNFNLRKNKFPTIQNNDNRIICNNQWEIINRLFAVYNGFKDINLYINSQGIMNPIDFSKVNQTYDEIIVKTKKIKTDFLNMEMEKNNSYSVILDYIVLFEKLLSEDNKMNKLLEEKANGGKYGYFQYRKDQKKRNSLNHKVFEKIKNLEMVEIDLIINNIYSHMLSMVKDFDHLFKVVDLDEEKNNHYFRMFNATASMSLYFNILVLLKLEIYDNHQILAIHEALLQKISKFNKNDLNGTRKYYDNMSEKLTDITRHKYNDDFEKFMEVAKLFLSYLFYDNDVDFTKIPITNFKKMIELIATAFMNIYAQDILVI